MQRTFVFMFASFALACVNPVVADHPVVFPWSSAHAVQSALPGSPSAPHQILARESHRHSAPVALQVMPPKTSYAYGWFGSNPTPQISRHLGFRQNYTQWTFKP
jgi:hypothetical protein